MKESKNSEEFDICQAFAESAEYRVPVGAVARLEELLGTGSMIKWGKIVSGISDKDLAILSVGLGEASGTAERDRQGHFRYREICTDLCARLYPPRSPAV